MAIVGAWGVVALCTFIGVFEPGHPSYTSLDKFSQCTVVQSANTVSMGNATIWCRRYSRNDRGLFGINGRIYR